jgi:ketosteroid isomerase-like protein
VQVSRENVEWVRRSFEAHAKGGIEASLPFYAPDGVWHAAPGWVEDPIYHGYDGLRRLDAVFAENFEDYDIALHEIRAAGGRVLALFEATGRVREAGLPIRQPVGFVLGFRDGMIGEVHSFFSWTEARAAAGLGE